MGIVLWILLGLIVLVGGLAAYLYFTGKLGAFVEGVKKQDAASTLAVFEGEKPPPPSEYEVAAQKLVDSIRQSSVSGNPLLPDQCRKFLLGKLSPANDKEKALEKVIVEYFASADEGQVENARMEAVSQYEAEIVRKAAAAAEAARLRQLAEVRRREEAIKRREQEEARRKEESERRKARQIVTNFRNRMTYCEQRLCMELNPYSEKNDIAGYRKLLESNHAEARKAPPQFAAYTRNMVNKTRQMERMLAPAWEWQKILTEGDPAVKGLNITIGMDFCKVDSIRSGVIYAKTVSGNTVSVPVEKILRTKSFLKFLVNLGYKNKKLGSIPFFFFWRNEPVIAKVASREVSSGEQRAYSRFVTDYLRVALKGRHRAKLIRKFGSTDEYKALMPRPKPRPRVVPRKAPAKKAAVKKTPPKKPSAKKVVSKKAPLKKKK